jgi:PAS domain-containing protein
MRIIILALLFFHLFHVPVFADVTKCALNSNVEGVIEAVANGNSNRIIDPENPIPYQRRMADLNSPDEVSQGLNLAQTKYNDYQLKLQRGEVSIGFHEQVQEHIRDQIGTGYTRALKPDEVAEIMRDGRTEMGQFFSKPQGAHVGHNGSAVYVKCVRDCDQYFEATSTGSGMQAVKPIPSENLEIIVPDYDAAFAAARSGNRTAVNTPPSAGIIVEDIEDMSVMNDAFRKLYQMSPSEMKGASLQDFVRNGRKFNTDLGVFDFDKSTLQKLAGGKNNGGVLRVQTKSGDSMIVKVLKDQNGNVLPAQEVLQEVRNAQLVHQMGVGPEAHLMKTKSGYNLVMRESPGINLKEILDPKNATTKRTKDTLDAFLGKETRNITEARKLYARRVLQDEELMRELKRVGRILDENGVESIDLQIMISPASSGRPASAQVIDSAMFNVGGAGASADNVYEINDMIRRLRRIADQ